MEFHSIFRIVAERNQQLRLPSNINVPILHLLVSSPKWEREKPVSDWNCKTVVGPPQRPSSELAILSFYEDLGWFGAWVYRPNKFMTSWEPRGWLQLLDMPWIPIANCKRCLEGKRAAGIFFCWRQGEFLFAESMWPESGDTIRQSQLAWLEAALEMGVLKDSFVVVQCTTASKLLHEIPLRFIQGSPKASPRNPCQRCPGRA